MWSCLVIKPMKPKASSVRGILNRIIRVAEKENVIYRILKDSNKTYLSGLTGYSRNGFCKKIKARSFSFSELIRIFKIIQNMSEEEGKKSRIDWEGVYIVNDGKKDASVRKVRKRSGGKEQGSLPGMPEEGAAGENLPEEES